jgi:hypothetical protein
MRAREIAVAAGIFAGLGLGCGPPPEAARPPSPTIVPAAAPVAAAPAVTAPAGPKEAVPSLHPCVPDFIVKELHGCDDGATAVDYSAVANAMAALAAAGPPGPQPKEKKPVPRALQPFEEKAALTARAFVCKRPDGDLDDEHATTTFDLGRLYLGANHFEEATVYLRDVVLLDPQKHGEVEYAARFLLEAVRGLTRDRPECLATFTAVAAAVDAHVCKSPGADQRTESCAAIAKVVADGPATPGASPNPAPSSPASASPGSLPPP